MKTINLFMALALVAGLILVVGPMPAWAAPSTVPPVATGPQTLSGFGGVAGCHEFFLQPGSSWKGDLMVGAGPTWSLVILDIDATGVTGPDGHFIYFNLQDAEVGSSWQNLGINFRLNFSGAGGGTLFQSYQAWTSEGISSHGLNPGVLTTSDFDLRFDFTKANAGDSWTVTPYFRLSGGTWTVFFDDSFTATVPFDVLGAKLVACFDGGADGTVSFNNYYLAGLASAVYVDDDWAGLPDGTAVLFPGDPNYKTIGVDAFATIQEGIDAVAGSTVNVAAGTYNESVVIDKSVSVIGAGATQTFVTEGIQIGGTFTGLTLHGMYLSGDAPGYKNAVIDSRPTTDPVSDITIQNCILDGENTSGRGAFFGHYITGTWRWEGNEIKNFPTWYVIDNTHSTHDVPYKMDAVYFQNNHVHDCGGSIAFRGKIDEPTPVAVVSGNTFEDYLPSAQSQVWAAIEVNNVTNLQVYDNSIRGVPEVQWGGEGQPLQIWSVTPWTVDIHDNTFTDNFQGIWIWTFLPDIDWSGPDTPLYVPGGSIRHNNISGNDEFGLWISNVPAGSATSSGIGGPLNAQNNWWGSPTGPRRQLPNGKWVGEGDKVSANVAFVPWLPHPIEFWKR